MRVVDISSFKASLNLAIVPSFKSPPPPRGFRPMCERLGRLRSGGARSNPRHQERICPAAPAAQLLWTLRKHIIPSILTADRQGLSAGAAMLVEASSFLGWGPAVPTPGAPCSPRAQPTSA